MSNCLLESCDRGTQNRGITDTKDHVVACLNRKHYSLRHAPLPGYTQHIKCVGEDNSIIAKLMTQDVGDDGMRKFSRHSRVKRWHQHIGRHNHAWILQFVL